ncbi:hypothetical protein TIFTF001_012602 [Ficus carica]|uniref:Uncharacterized protein n=1 Tax=Ficus carica TaxID=3494 RepID=A0AA87ZZA6_FICCA|nr:hypothetical protein TIFTF001_012602 [Ficus carica]
MASESDRRFNNFSGNGVGRFYMGVSRSDLADKLLAVWDPAIP